MTAPIHIRPMRDEDVEPAHEVARAAFTELDRLSGVPYPGPEQVPQAAHARLRHVLRTDAPGAWVAERDGEVVGCAAAILREGLWGLSLLVVHPSAQSAGTGRELLARAWAYGEGARAWMVLSSNDPRAIRAYARLGLAMHPAVRASGTPRGVAMPPGVARGTRADLPLTEAVDRAVRGAVHGEDIAVMIENGSELLVVADRGYAVTTHGETKLLAATDEDAARDLLSAAFATTDGTAVVDFVTAGQNWAVAPCLDAGLEVRTDAGAVFLGGELGPLTPYIPSGAYL